MGTVKNPGNGSQKLALRLGDFVLGSFEQGDLTTYRSAVALMRTVFEDHYADPEHAGLFITSGRPSTAPASYDFTVVHRGAHVVLSDFTFQYGGPRSVALPLLTYVREAVRFAEAVIATPPVCRSYSDLESRELARYRQYLLDLVGLGRGALGGHNYWELCEEFHMVHGSLKQALRLKVTDIMDDSGGKLRAPQVVHVEICNGPLHIGEKTTVRLNGGDVVLATVRGFDASGASVLLEGIGPGGLHIGDELIGLQCFYP